MSHYASLGLLIIGTVLVVGGIVLAATGTGKGPEWVGKTVAIIVGALITLAGGAQLRSDQ